jgi:hypothetical protein
MLTETILDELKRDISSFADPGTIVRVSENRLVFVRQRVECEAGLQKSVRRFPDIRVRDRLMSYEAFLASELMADLRDLAQSVEQQLPAADVFIPVPARGSDSGSDLIQSEDACQFVLEQAAVLENLPVARTRVLFVHGNAGTGKTSVLRQAARIQAGKYLRGEVPTLLLYLDAQGKGLLQLEDVMARALQDLRAKFTYHSIATLTRRHCVVPIVDGFDELIGPSSAREAFANLAQFLAQLDREGAVITSSRSGFIDYRTLYERAEEAAGGSELAYQISPVEVLPWSKESIFSYCDARSGRSPETRQRIGELVESAAEPLISKPFFLSKVCDILIEGGRIQTQQDLVRQVVDAALERESKKLLDRQKKPVLTAEQHRSLCESISEEMWLEGTAEIDLETLQLLAEVFADEVPLGREDAKLLADRIRAHGLLATAGLGEDAKRSFEHEVFRFEFQAGRFSRRLLDPDSDLSDYLLRGEVPEDVARRLTGYGAWSDVDVKGAVSRLSTVAERSSRGSLASANSGTLVGGILWNRSRPPVGLRIHALNMRGVELGKSELHSADIQNCVFERVGLGDVSLQNCEVRGTKFVACRLVGDGKWTGTLIDPHDFIGAIVPAGGGEKEVYDPRLIANRLTKMGALLPELETPRDLTAETSAEVELVELLLRRTRTHYYLPESEPWVQKKLLNARSWNVVKSLMLKHGILRSATFEKSGRPDVFWKLSMAPDVLWQARGGGGPGVPESAAAFWRDLLAGSSPPGGHGAA